MPLNLEIKELRIAKLINANYIYASLSISGLIRGRVIINEIKVLEPVINWERKLTANVASQTTLADISEPIAQTKKILDSPRTKKNY